MADWLPGSSKKKQDADKIEDFVLYEDTNTESTAEDPEFSDTDRLELPDYLLEDKPHGRFGKIFTFCKKHKKLLVGSGIGLISLILIVAMAIAIPILTDPLRGYAQATVSKGNVISTMKVSGTLSANAHYSITSLVSGKVLESSPQVGDRVEAGTVLYRLDDTDAQLALKRAENQLERSRAAGSYTTSPLRIYAAESGVIQSLTIKNGHSVSAGQVIGTLKRSDESIVSITSSVFGTIYSVNVSQGVSVSSGTLLATVRDNQAEQSQRSSIYDQKSNEYDVESAKNQLENYTIVAPVSGVVTEKNAKVGDNVAMANTSQPMMVITDTASMRFTFQVEEKKLSEIKPGLRANVSTDSVPNETFSGTVKSISPEGVRNKEGKLMFDVEVLVENPGTLKAGMDVSAKIILASASNVLFVPEKALQNPNGQTAFVLVKELIPSDVTETAPVQPTASAASGKEDKLPEIEVPKGCRLATVRYGITNGKNVQIISGLKQGETVVYHPQWETPELKPAATATATPTKPDTTTTTNPAATEGSPSDEALRQEIMDRIRENQAESNPTGTTPKTQTVFPIS
ncbi:MAG: HlyD family efflux transporter periplasmic adaptor subunit [Clostridia bacterium]|nr:HlyD family efflux transporter periplasmic adaptor subunit [Clostridia bacterium]